MKKNKIILLCLSTLALLQACKEDKMLIYNSQDGIQFQTKTAIGAKNSRKSTQGSQTIFNYGLQKLGDSLLVDTLVVFTQIQGRLTDKPRYVKLKAIPAEDGKMPEITFKERYEIAPSTDVSLLEMYVKRPANRKEVCRAKIVFDVEGTDFVRGVDELQEVEILLKDEVTLEMIGGTKAQWQLQEKFDFGKYSETKLRLLMTVLKTISWTEIRASMKKDAELIKIMNVLQAYNAAHPGKPMVDEDGDPISFPWLE